ncbi:tripartite tricarboxylate transporter TctB family protein [Lentibacillus sp. CBA3610]|uniref:tripartite tricarboxylate transporter TctB family protein n=1 Tax=Lentibacillus sp. CBA3610 TaxID=2518176 RepID=UPI001595F9D9|nr:tripartite tricarboxylate transporter TctB family protein [Lentibacillus sp. CBA3610]QKY68433.1 tripartite tricarboxylate transporter TctB family protein [Lentibacillus sp. CBA3610]
MARLVVPSICIVAGIIYLVLTFNLTRSNVGDPNGPLYFPILIGVVLMVFSIVYFLQEWKKRGEKFEEFKALFIGRTPFLIVSTLIMIFVYTILFERIGFLFSTMIFLSGLLFIVNGRKSWIKNIVIAVLFSVVAWYSFSELLNVSLP